MARGEEVPVGGKIAETELVNDKKTTYPFNYL